MSEQAFDCAVGQGGHCFDGCWLGVGVAFDDSSSEG